MKTMLRYHFSRYDKRQIRILPTMQVASPSTQMFVKHKVVMQVSVKFNV